MLAASVDFDQLRGRAGIATVLSLCVGGLICGVCLFFIHVSPSVGALEGCTS